MVIQKNTKLDRKMVLAIQALYLHGFLSEQGFCETISQYYAWRRTHFGTNKNRL
jgi:hypothetical protein